MTDGIQIILHEWELPPWLTLLTALTMLIYLRGWFALRRTRPEQFNVGRLCAFMGGMISLWLAIGSPMDGLADVLLSAHMIEHLILMMVVPPLVLLGLPVVPLLRGLPVFLRRGVVGPLLRLRPLRRFTHWFYRKYRPY